MYKRQDDSREGVEKFLKRNPTTSVVAEKDGEIIGAILCGHDGRRGCMYHVCVAKAWREHGIGHKMALAAMEALKAEGINKVSLIAFRSNTIGNKFWRKVGWTFRDDLNYYDFTLNEKNITRFIEEHGYQEENDHEEDKWRRNGCERLSGGINRSRNQV